MSYLDRLVVEDKETTSLSYSITGLTYVLYAEINTSCVDPHFVAVILLMLLRFCTLSDVVSICLFHDRIVSRVIPRYLEIYAC